MNQRRVVARKLVNERSRNLETRRSHRVESGVVGAVGDGQAFAQAQTRDEECRTCCNLDSSLGSQQVQRPEHRVVERGQRQQLVPSAHPTDRSTECKTGTGPPRWALARSPSSARANTSNASPQ